MFSDIGNHWASGCIVALARRKLINGYPNGTFRPLATVARAEFAALMQRVFPNLLTKQPVAQFTDVKAQYWASGAIAWASERGLFSGYDDGTFRPGQTLSRAQAILVLIAGFSAGQSAEPVGFESENVPPDALAEQFLDAAEIPDYAREAIAQALDQKILATLDQPRPLRPAKAVTRGEVAALFCQALEIPAAERERQYPALTAAQDRKAVFAQFLQQESGFDAEQLAFLDRKIERSPYRNQVADYAVRLQLPEGAAAIQQSGSYLPYPERGDIPLIQPALDFLSPDILSGCVCLSTVRDGRLQSWWLGRAAIAPRQLWSSTKFVPLLNTIAQANRTAPDVKIDRTRIRRAGGEGGFPFHDLAKSIMTYDNRVATSNALAATFKRFETPERLERWMQNLTGNESLVFQGRYGETAFIDNPELWDTIAKKQLLKSPVEQKWGQNLVSTYDLTRLITMAGWHWRLPTRSRIPDIQAHSLDSLVRAMGADTARYADAALETLGLSNWAKSPVVISKSGFGRSDERDRTELTYCALVQFSLPRQGTSDLTAAYQHYSLGFTLIAAQGVGDANKEARYVDALMTAEVTELLRRVVTESL
ncbi:MAG: S-layer homology domain-containing protein [Phormidesmis sp.]